MPSAPISAAVSPAVNEIVAAVPGRRIRVLGYCIVADSAVSATWKSGTNALSGAMKMATGVPINPAIGGNSLDPVEQFVTNAGEALNLTLSGAVQVSGHVTFDIIT